MQRDCGDGPVVAGRATELVCAWLLSGGAKVPYSIAQITRSSWYSWRACRCGRRRRHIQSHLDFRARAMDPRLPGVLVPVVAAIAATACLDLASQATRLSARSRRRSRRSRYRAPSRTFLCWSPALLGLHSSPSPARSPPPRPFTARSGREQRGDDRDRRPERVRRILLRVSGSTSGASTAVAEQVGREDSSRVWSQRH